MPVDRSTEVRIAHAGDNEQGVDEAGGIRSRLLGGTSVRHSNCSPMTNSIIMA